MKPIKNFLHFYLFPTLAAHHRRCNVIDGVNLNRGAATVRKSGVITAGLIAAWAAALCPAPVAAQTRLDAAPVSIAGWTVGGLAYGANNTAPVASQFHDKLRAGPGLALSGVKEGMALRSWIAPPVETAAGLAGQAGGLLLDVPFAGFTFTPSFGAARSGGSSPVGAATLSLRSQLEVGYQFDNASRLALGYSRISGLGAGGERLDGDVLSLSFRLPFSAFSD
jgi:lipid A 3-O-deacylase